MALTTASLPLIVVVIDQPRQPMPKARILGFLSYAMSGRDFAILRRGKDSKAVIVTARLHPCRCLVLGIGP